MKKRLLASKRYRDNGASLSVWFIPDDQKDPDDVIGLVIQPAKGRGRRMAIQMRPDEALSLAAILTDSVYSITSEFGVSGTLGDAFQRPNRRK